MLTMFWLLACGSGDPEDASSTQLADDGPSNGTVEVLNQVRFEDVTEAAGLDFVYFNGGTGHYFFNEIIGGGGALFDADNDGDLDLFLAQGQLLADSRDDVMVPYTGDWPPRDRFYRNDGVNDAGVPQFIDVSAASGLDGDGYAQGAAVGDYDQDGDVDLYVTHWGGNRLYRNRGDGTFEDVTAASGTGDESWGVSAAFVDVDNDGWLDLFIGNYTVFDLENNQACGGGNDYCHPKRYPAAVDTLYRNRGDGTFENITVTAGIDRAFGRALGVVAADFDGDGRMDIYVANDASANQLWMNRTGDDGRVRFEEMAMLAGAALNETGQPEASMGVDAADFDGDGDEDLFMTHLRSETNTVYANQGNGMFSDVTVMSGLGVSSLPYTGFGTAWFDADNDGWLDVFVANGAVSRDGIQGRESEPFPFGQRNQLFLNRAGRFSEITDAAGAAFEPVEVSRGAMFGDLDNDGDADIVVTNNSGPARLLLNRTDSDSAWLGLQVWDGERRRDAFGARVMVTGPDGRELWRRVRADASYASANDPRVLIGLGEARATAHVTVVWADGSREVFSEVPTGQYSRLVKGQSDE